MGWLFCLLPYRLRSLPKLLTSPPLNKFEMSCHSIYAKEKRARELQLELFQIK